MNGCPDREKSIYLYAVREMPEERKKAFADHLAQCPACRAELQGLKEMLKQVKTAGQAPQLRRQDADAMTRRILGRLGPNPADKPRRRLTWPRLVPSLAAVCAAVIFVGIFSYRALDREEQAPMMTGFQTEQAFSPDEPGRLQEQDMELLMEFNTVQKLVRVLDASPQEGRGIDNDDSVLRKRTYAEA